jgi:hypothetical protein
MLLRPHHAEGSAEIQHFTSVEPVLASSPLRLVWRSLVGPLRLATPSVSIDELDPETLAPRSGVLPPTLSPTSISRRMASPRLRMRFANAQSSSASTSLGVIIVVMRSVFFSAFIRNYTLPQLVRKELDKVTKVDQLYQRQGGANSLLDLTPDPETPLV